MAYLGPEATHSFEAARFKFPSAALIPCDSFEDIFARVDLKQADVGVVPVQNSTSGIILEPFQILFEWQQDEDIRVLDEYYMRINNYIAAKQHVSLSSVRTVYTNSEVQKQCQKWLQRHLPTAQIITVASTAAAAKYVANSTTSDEAALCNLAAAKKYKLVQLVRLPVQDDWTNSTRFLVVGREGVMPIIEAEKWQTMFFVVMKDRPKALVDVLSAFARRDVNLTEILKGPLRSGAGIFGVWKDWFCLQFEGKSGDEAVTRATEEVSQQQSDLVKSLVNLGTFPIRPRVLAPRLPVLARVPAIPAGARATDVGRSEDLGVGTASSLHPGEGTLGQQLADLDAKIIGLTTMISRLKRRVKANDGVFDDLNTLAEQFPSYLETQSQARARSLLSITVPRLEGRLTSLLLSEGRKKFGPSLGDLKNALGISARGVRFTFESVLTGLQNWNAKYPEEQLMPEGMVARLASIRTAWLLARHGGTGGETKISLWDVEEVIREYFEVLEFLYERGVSDERAEGTDAEGTD